MVESRRWGSCGLSARSLETPSISYPWGLQVGGSTAWLEYRAAVVSLPVVNEKYVPQPGASPRPAMGIGVTPTTGLRIGASFTTGPYLSQDPAPLLPGGKSWKDYRQRVAGLELEFSRGYFELNGELIFSSYDAPTSREAVPGMTHHLETKYTFTPRLFVAVRFEQNDYAFIAPRTPRTWMVRTANFYDVEAGAGFRLDHRTLLKFAYRRDYWTVEPALKSILPNGYSFSVQLSHSFDVTSWFRRPR